MSKQPTPLDFSNPAAISDEMLWATHPRPWVVYSKRGSNWIKDANDQWVGFAYNLGAAHQIVAIVNRAPAPSSKQVAQPGEDE